VLAAVKISLPFTDLTAGAAPPSSINVTPTEAPLAAITASMEIVRVSIERGAARTGVSAETMLPIAIEPASMDAASVIADGAAVRCLASASIAPSARTAARTIAGQRTR
jgi:hypothetical protein